MYILLVLSADLSCSTKVAVYYYYHHNYCTVVYAIDVRVARVQKVADSLPKVMPSLRLSRQYARDMNTIVLQRLAYYTAVYWGVRVQVEELC